MILVIQNRVIQVLIVDQSQKLSLKCKTLMQLTLNNAEHELGQESFDQEVAGSSVVVSANSRDAEGAVLQVVPNVDNHDHVPTPACVPNVYRPRSSSSPVVEQPVRPVLHRPAAKGTGRVVARNHRKRQIGGEHDWRDWQQTDNFDPVIHPFSETAGPSVDTDGFDIKDYLQSNLSIWTTQGTGQKWSLQGGGQVIEVIYNVSIVKWTEKQCPLYKGGPVMEVVTLGGFTVIHSFSHF